MIKRRCNIVRTSMLVWASVFFRWCHELEAFQPINPRRCFILQQPLLLHPQSLTFHARQHVAPLLYSANFDGINNDDNEEEEEEDDIDDDDVTIDADTLGDWRTFRRNLVAASAASPPSPTTSSSTTTVSQKQTSSKFLPKSVSKDNEDLLWSQSEKLAREYTTGVWAHTTATPEVGGLVVRMPLEVEMYRNKKHSLMGRKLHRDIISTSSSAQINETKFDKMWYFRAQNMAAEEMKIIASKAKNGQIDASLLSDTSADMLQLYLDQQETWQSVCLVTQRDEAAGTATTLVLNRPMALKLTDNLARLVLFGAFPATSTSTTGLAAQSKTHLLIKFMLSFGQECAVYIGGPDAQDQPALMIHGHSDLTGAVELAPGTNVYMGGSLDAAMDGVLKGKYNPMDFRFFVGRHEYKDHALDVAVVLGKYQPIACARSLVLKQCISLPKPLWHEVLEFCGGDLREISALELLKRDDMQVAITEDDDDDDADEVLLDDYEIPDELGELEILDDDDDEFDENFA